MRIVGDPRRRGEAAIVVRHEDREEGLGGGRGGETPEAQLLDEAILERAVGALDPALRLRAVGAETVDVEGAEGAAELRESRATLGAIAGRDVKDAEPVAVERHGLAVTLEVAPGRVEVIERGLGVREAELHEAAGGVVDVDQQRAARATILEPGVLAAIELDQPRRAPARQPPLGDPRQDLQAIQFLHAQPEGSSHPGTVPEKRTSLLWRNRTFALWAYRPGSDRQGYVNFGA